MTPFPEFHRTNNASLNVSIGRNALALTSMKTKIYIPPPSASNLTFSLINVWLGWVDTVKALSKMKSWGEIPTTESDTIFKHNKAIKKNKLLF